MTAGKYNGFVIEKGADFSPGEIVWKDSDDVPINLTGFTARMDVKKSVSDSPSISLTTENSRIALGGVSGSVTLNVLAADTDSLTSGSYKYDLELVSSGGAVTRLIEGSIAVKENVTT